jgi:predicted nucleic acid-binding Zn ribbon protein
MKVPRYDYACKRCGRVQELTVRRYEDAPKSIYCVWCLDEDYVVEMKRKFPTGIICSMPGAENPGTLGRKM